MHDPICSSEGKYKFLPDCTKTIILKMYLLLKPTGKKKMIYLYDLTLRNSFFIISP